MKQIKNYAAFTKASRENFQPKGFHFDVDMFENLIDCWTSFDDIPVILQTTKADLDRFCKVVYNMNYRETYNILSGITDAFMRKTFKNLASSGNNTAMSIVSKHFMKLDDSQNNNVNITIVNDLKDDGEV